MSAPGEASVSGSRLLFYLRASMVIFDIWGDLWDLRVLGEDATQSHIVVLEMVRHSNQTVPQTETIANLVLVILSASNFDILDKTFSI